MNLNADIGNPHRVCCNYPWLNSVFVWKANPWEVYPSVFYSLPHSSYLDWSQSSRSTLRTISIPFLKRLCHPSLARDKSWMIIDVLFGSNRIYRDRRNRWGFFLSRIKEYWFHKKALVLKRCGKGWKARRLAIFSLLLCSVIKQSKHIKLF